MKEVQDISFVPVSQRISQITQWSREHIRVSSGDVCVIRGESLTPSLDNDILLQSEFNSGVVWLSLFYVVQAIGNSSRL